MDSHPNATVPLSEEYERQARAEEESPVPFILKLIRVVTWVLYVVVLFNVIMLAMAFFLRLAAANPDAGFAAWVYRSADRSMDPFRGLFPTRELTNESVLDLSLLFAAVVYLVVAFLLDALLRWIGRQVHGRERRITELRVAARNAAANEYNAAQQLAAQERAAQQTAAAVAAATQQQPAIEPPAGSTPPPEPPAASGS